ncbi:neuropeptide-like precursor 1 precursor [Bombyx mori]|uniref:Neuropeptide-like 1 n=1 Tax=Bombyx mori TaxID=7091 RepID=B3IWA6_BOMMO|nr:neuropeptide-like precursor 1 precursor [Bombyx mori]BAG49563.1 neuropeptide-like precursor 1 [Bombyx mori]
MKGRSPTGKRRGCFLLIVLFAVIFSAYVEQVLSLPTEPENQWPTFPRRNIATLAKNGYLRNSGANSYKRSISILAKNGMLPTYRSPYVGTDKQEHEDESQEKRNLASIARLRSYSAMKRNIQALARDGYRMGRGQYNTQNNKRNIAALARNGLLHKKDEINGDEYYFPFYQNPIPPLSEIDGPFDINEMYDFQQTINPDMFPPLSQVAKRSALGPENDYAVLKDFEDNAYLKKGSVGLPAHGLYRPLYRDPNIRTKRYILSLPDYIETNNIDDKNDNENEDKRSVGSIPLTRISELGNISLLPKLTQQSIQTTPTYRRRQYLLTRTQPAESSTDR